MFANIVPFSKFSRYGVPQGFRRSVLSTVPPVRYGDPSSHAVKNENFCKCGIFLMPFLPLCRPQFCFFRYDILPRMFKKITAGCDWGLVILDQLNIIAGTEASQQPLDSCFSCIMHFQYPFQKLNFYKVSKNFFHYNTQLVFSQYFLGCLQYFFDINFHLCIFIQYSQ